MEQLPGISDIASPLVDALLRDIEELHERREAISVELRTNPDTIAVSFRTPLFSERDFGHLVGLRTYGDLPPFKLFVVHDPIGVRIELLVRI